MFWIQERHTQVKNEFMPFVLLKTSTLFFSNIFTYAFCHYPQFFFFFKPEPLCGFSLNIIIIPLLLD